LVWFLWENDSFLIYTKPGSQKVPNFKRNPNVSLNFGTGDPVAVFTGVVEWDIPVSAESKAAYLKKYHQGILDINLTDESMLQEYSLALRITPTKLRGF
jgi:PPOX class probable F420-dependent enzyme